MQEAWQQQRARLNHDWLKNQWIPALSKFVRLIQGEVIDDSGFDSFYKCLQEEFPIKIQRIDLLVQQFTIDMSPRRLFERLPLLICDDETRSVVGDLVHELWMVRMNVAENIDSAASAVKRAQCAGRRLFKQLSNEKATGPLYNDEIIGLTKSLQECCADLSAKISLFPAKIVV